MDWQYRKHRRPAVVGAFVLFAVSALVIASVAGGAIRTVTFDDLPVNTRVSTEYETSHGVKFVSHEGIRPLVKSSPSQAHSGDRIGVYSCEGLQGCGEGFFDPQLRGTLTTTATSVSTYVGYWDDPAFPGPPDSFMVRIRAYNSSDVVVAESSYVTVSRGAPLTQQISATAPAGQQIAYFDVIADGPDGPEGKTLAIDDVSVTTPDGPQPADFTLNAGQTVVDVLTGNSVEVPVDINRLNGSNGDVSFSVSGLPTGMSASFNPNPVPGTGSRTTLTLAAAEGAAHSDQYSEITVTAAPGPGAGASQRSIKKLVRIRENCDRTVRFDYVDARSESCMVRRSGHFEATNAEVRINGLVVEPADDSRPTLLIDPGAGTIKGKELTRPWRVSVASSPTIPIYAGPIDWKFTGTGDGPRKVLGFDISGVKKLNGLPVTGYDASFLRSGKATIKPTLRLDFWPFNYFGNITTSATFTTDNDHGADFSGLELKLPKVTALALELKDVQLKWQQGGTWAGGATLVLRTAKSLEVGAGFGIKNGGFDYLRGSIGNLNKPIGSGIFLQAIGFEVADSPLRLSGSIGVSAGPAVAGVKAIGVGGTLKATLADPFIIEIAGNARVADRFKLGEAFVRYSSTGFFQFGAKADWDFWRLSLGGSVEGWVDGLQAFNVEGSLRACLDVWGPDPCGSAKGILSSKGIAGCVGVYGYYVGAGATWNFDFDAFTGCDLAPYREVKPARARAAGTLTSTRLPQGLRSAAWEVTAEGGPTGVTLAGPNGESVTVSRDAPVVQNDQFLAQLRQDGTTFVLVNKPAAGVWTLSDDGTAPGAAGARGARPPGAVGLRQGEGARTRSRAVLEHASHSRPARDVRGDRQGRPQCDRHDEGRSRLGPLQARGRPGRQAPDRRARGAERSAPDNADRRLVPRAGNAPPRPAEGAEGTAQAIAPRGQLAAAAVRLPPRGPLPALGRQASRQGRGREAPPSRPEGRAAPGEREGQGAGARPRERQGARRSCVGQAAAPLGSARFVLDELPVAREPFFALASPCEPGQAIDGNTVGVGFQDRPITRPPVVARTLAQPGLDRVQPDVTEDVQQLLIRNLPNRLVAALEQMPE